MGGLYDAATLRALTLALIDIFLNRERQVLEAQAAVLCLLEWNAPLGSSQSSAIKGMRTPGVESGSQAWEACMMPLHYVRSHESGRTCGLDFHDTGRGRS